jgi:hypothetical protein
MAGMKMASTTASTIMAATAIAGHIKHRHDKHGRGAPKAGLYLHLPVYTSVRPLLLLRQKGDEDNSTVQPQVAEPARASLKQIEAITRNFRLLIAMSNAPFL